ncbi:MAG: electron transfer flavoprotein subunit alpha/FixB family protein [Saprospiraceae bacterium]
MAVLIYAEAQSNTIKKTAQECVFYGKKVAEVLGVDCVALVLGNTDSAGDLGIYGADKVIHINSISDFDSKAHTNIISQVANNVNAKVVIVSHTANGKSLVGRLAIRLNAGSVSSVNSVPTYNGSYKVKKSLFSGKAIGEYEVKSEKLILSLSGNSFKIREIGSPVTAESIDIKIPEASVKVIETKREEGSVPLPEAELVVSAGRGMKGPENWGIIEELAQVLGATTACSRPVADIGWRPHHEHVGQTGVAIKPNLYIAAGISGAIQHLAGVNNSKVIVVINKDPEAPFFKAADYGVLGDLFEIVPRLTEALKKYKATL